MTIVARTYRLRSPLTDLPVQCSGSSSSKELPSQSVYDMPCLADPTVVGQQFGMLELDDEAEVYALLRDGLPALQAWFVAALHEVYHSCPASTFDNSHSVSIRNSLTFRICTAFRQGTVFHMSRYCMTNVKGNIVIDSGYYD